MDVPQRELNQARVESFGRDHMLFMQSLMELI
jgi:hypothetical protein